MEPQLKGTGVTFSKTVLSLFHNTSIKIIRKEHPGDKSNILKEGYKFSNIENNVIIYKTKIISN